jgi:hypothetical protein
MTGTHHCNIKLFLVPEIYHAHSKKQIEVKLPTKTAETINVIKALYKILCSVTHPKFKRSE